MCNNNIKAKKVRRNTPLPPGKNRVKKMKTTQKKSEKASNTTRQNVKRTIKRMCIQDKQLMKKTFHDITTFTVKLTSPGMDTTLTPQAWRGTGTSTRRTYGSSRSRGTAGAPAGAGRTGPPGVPSGLPLGPLPLPGAPQQGPPGAPHQGLPIPRSSLTPPGDSSPYSPSRPTQTSASPSSASPGERAKPPGTWAARDAAAADGNTKQLMKVNINERVNDPDNLDNPLKIAKDIYDNHSGRLVEYSSDSDSDNASAEEGARELSPRPISTPASPSPSPTQRRRNAQGEAVLNSFSSR